MTIFPVWLLMAPVMALPIPLDMKFVILSIAM